MTEDIIQAIQEIYALPEHIRQMLKSLQTEAEHER